MKKKLLKKNLRLLEKQDSKLYYQLSTVDPSHLEFCQTQQDELNLKRDYQGKTYYYHSQSQARQEAIDWFKQLDLQQATVLYVYGIGLGYYYEAAKDWLKSNRQHVLIFLEEDLEVLYHLFETEIGNEILKNPQVQIVYSPELLEDKALFNELTWTYILAPFAISCLNMYGEVNPDGFAKLHHLLSHHSVQKKILVDEYLQYGIVFFRNFYPNLLELPHSYLGNGLFNQFQQIPAIICGAGPSLKKNIQVLKTLTNQALLFAGGSSLNALTSQGIIPHFGAGIDPNKGQYERILATFKYRIPFFYRNRLFHEALKALIGPRLYLTGSGGYDIATWFDAQLGLEGEALDEGHNVVNFCMEIAHALGCNPIILVGVDLAFTDQQLYAEGVIAHPHLGEEQLKQVADVDSQLLLKQDIHGNPIHTLWKWITEAEWIAEFAQNHPEVTLINATEGGLGFQDVPNLTLSEVAKNHLKESFDLNQRIQAEISKHSLAHLTQAQISNLMKSLEESLNRCVQYFDMLTQEMKQVAEKIKKKEDYPESLQTPTADLTEMNIEEEVGYQYVLDMFNLIYIRLHHRLIQELQFPKRRISTRKRDLQKIQLQTNRLGFLKDVARINIELIKRTLKD